MEPSATLRALSDVETGNRWAVGRAGERTPFQILPSVWREYSRVPMKRATPAEARRVALAILDDRGRAFRRAHGRGPTAFETYLLWHCPARVDRPTTEDRRTAERFEQINNER